MIYLPEKTLFRRFMANTFTEATDRKSTMGLDHFGKKYTVGEKDFKLQLWDTGGRFALCTIFSTVYFQNA